MRYRAVLTLIAVLLSLISFSGLSAADTVEQQADREMRSRLDAPLLFTKRHSYTGIHIYDTYYKWPPGGGGIYVLENPAAPRDQWKIRPVIDPTTPETLGVGVYTDPELSYDAKRILFTFKGEPNGNTSIFEIGVDGRGLRRLTDPTPTCDCYKGNLAGQHDVCPNYLPDGRIVFLSTRASGLVPCFNTGVAILHVMNADGSDIHSISVNNVNEFDPCVLPDGRILFGRWEYIDKNALTIQSLWTVNPDGTQETALYANNMVFPEAILDARPVPGTALIVGTFAKHNGTPRGSIALVDPRKGKNDPAAIANLEHPDEPTFDKGDSCEPWPVSSETFVFSGRPQGQKRNVLEMIDRAGRRITLLSDPEICLHDPMLVKPRSVPPVLADATDRSARTGRFFVQDIYKGLDGVRRGEVKQLRVIEETSRISPTHMTGSPYNQTFLVSAALAFSVKNYLGVVPVDESGSAYFEVPAGRAIYLQALDADGRMIQSMRTFVQAAPGTTRSCIGCHEHKFSTPSNEGLPAAFGRTPDQLQPESWGTGFIDYASMVQPVLDRHCVRCHGGPEGFGGGMDLSGGWTEHFNISYENLANRRETQLVAYWIAGIDCMNGTALWSSQLFKPRGHGSGAAPLANLLVNGHDGLVDKLSRKERDLLMAWIDTNGLYYGTWDDTVHGCTISEWGNLKKGLTQQMQQAGCLGCHGDGRNAAYFENDWINLQSPEMSRILRAPLAAGGEGFGAAMCRQRKVDPKRQRIHLLWDGYAHAVKPPEEFPKHPLVPADASASPATTFQSIANPRYQAMLGLIREARTKTLQTPRIDMPGAEVIPGECRQFNPPPLPEFPPAPAATVDRDGMVHLAWERSARTIGLRCELHRGERETFKPGDETLLVKGPVFQYLDRDAPTGKQHYALVLTDGIGRSKPSYLSVVVPQPLPPDAPRNVRTLPSSGSIRLAWDPPSGAAMGFNVYRQSPQSQQYEKITAQPVRSASCADADVQLQTTYRYVVRAVGPRGVESEPSAAIEASATIIQEPVFAVSFDKAVAASLHGGQAVSGSLDGKARAEAGVLDLSQGGYASFPHGEQFDLAQPLTLELWVRFDRQGKMPVIACHGVWNQAGWFMQWLGNQWRWHVGGVDCDGGKPAADRWIHLVGAFDGKALRLYQDGTKVAERAGPFNTASWSGDLLVGQYSSKPAPEFQVNGSISGVKIYHRLLNEQEIAKAAQKPPQ